MNLSSILGRVPLEGLNDLGALPVGHPLIQAVLERKDLPQDLRNRVFAAGTQVDVEKLTYAKLDQEDEAALIERLSREPSWEDLAEEVATACVSPALAKRLVETWQGDVSSLWGLLKNHPTLRLRLGERLIEQSGQEVTFPFILKSGHPEVHEHLAHHLLTLPNWWDNGYVDTILTSPWTRESTKAQIVQMAPGIEAATSLTLNLLSYTYAPIGSLLADAVKSALHLEEAPATRHAATQEWAEKILDTTAADLALLLEEAPEEAYPLIAERGDAPHSILLDERILHHLRGIFRTERLGGRNSPEHLAWVVAQPERISLCRAHLATLNTHDANEFTVSAVSALTSDDAEVILDIVLSKGCVNENTVLDVPWQVLRRIITTTMVGVEEMLAHTFAATCITPEHWETLTALQETFRGTVRQLTQAVQDIHHT